MIRRPPSSTRTDHPFPTRRSSDLELGAERDTALGRCDLQAGRRADRAFKESTAIARNASGLGNAGDLPARSQAARLHYLVGEDVHRSAAREPHRILKRRSEEHTSELQSLMRISYAVFCLKKKKQNRQETQTLVHTEITTQPKTSPHYNNATK